MLVEVVIISNNILFDLEQVHAASSTTKKEEFNIKVVRGKLNDIEVRMLLIIIRVDCSFQKTVYHMTMLVSDVIYPLRISLYTTCVI